jgi:laminin alpha 3/5
MCADGYYSLKRDDVFGCEPCRCALGGSLHSICDKQTGQCVCRPSIVGRECNQPAFGHYFPTLHQLQYELEDGLTAKHQTPVRYEFDSSQFENFSWKGYVRYSSLQSEVQLHIQLIKPTAYRLLIRYKTYNKTSMDSNNLEYKIPQMNINFASIRETGTVAPQTFDIDLPQSDRQATFATASTLLTSDTAPNNEYLLTLKTIDPILVDYIVFIPIDYIEAQVLQQIDAFAYGRPCELDDEEECYQYQYPSLNGLSSISHPIPSSISNGPIIDLNLLQELSIDSLTTIERGRDYRYDWMISKPGQYYLLVDYHTIDAGTSYARVQTIDGDILPGSLVLTECPYTFVCRQMVTTLTSSGNHRINKPKLMTVTDTRRATVIINVVQQTDRSSPIGIQKITAVPAAQFNYDLLRPQFLCVRGSSEDGPHGLSVCDDSNKPSSNSSTAPIQIFQAEDYYNEHLKTNYLPSALPNTAVVPLNFSTPNIYVYGRLTDVYEQAKNYPATFQFHIHYYQSNSYSTSDTIPLTVIFYSRTGDSQIGEINAPVCQRRTPGGCSQIVTLQNGSTAIRLDEPEFTAYLALLNPNTSLLIDYLTAQKIEPKTQKIAIPIPSTADADRASKFVQECIAKSAPNYDLKIQQASPFCRQALYSLSATFNEQASSCSCDIRGSTDPNGQCEPYGGQCSCKANVIGRRCDRCRTGYWGFPNCRPCTCPTKICNELTGDCICPPRVTGRYCDQCSPRTYGFGMLLIPFISHGIIHLLLF